MSKEELQAKMDLIADQLIDYGDSVVILISEPTGDTGEIFHSCRGNYHAIVGLLEDMKTICLAERIAQVQDKLKE
jgi:hypothetical protein